MDRPEKMITLRDILTDEEIRKAFYIYKSDPSRYGAQKIADELIRPKIEEINTRLGHPNDPLYLAYACEYAFIQSECFNLN